jgi:cytoskeletal protein CcmA (bactofilin family)
MCPPAPDSGDDHHLFNRAAMNAPPSPPHTFAPANDEPLVLGPSVVLNGSIESSGEVVIYGRVEGQVRANRVLIAQPAKVSGTLVASEVIIDGEADDILIFAAKIVLRDGSYVTGEIWHKELVLEAGHVFEGKSRRHVSPQNLASSMMDSPPAQKPVKEAGDAPETDN